MKKFIVSLMVACFVFGFISEARAEGIKGFAVGARPVWYIAPDVDGFEATSSKVTATKWYWSSTTTTYQIEGSSLYGIAPFMRLGFTENIGLEAAYDFLFGSDVSLNVGNVSAIAMFGENFRPYIKAGACYGEFDWDGPGGFDADAGFQAGAGFEGGLGENFGVGLDVLYRSLENDYKVGDEWEAEDDSIDLSGVGIGFDLLYRF